MERMIPKRIRSVNWDEEEKSLLKEVLKDYAEIISNKDLNTNTLKEKNKAWAAVHERFNQLNTRPRDLKQIRIQWKTMKVGTKQYRYYPRKSTKSDGGPKPQSLTYGHYETINLMNPGVLMDYSMNMIESDEKNSIPVRALSKYSFLHQTMNLSINKYPVKSVTSSPDGHLKFEHTYTIIHTMSDTTKNPTKNMEFHTSENTEKSEEPASNNTNELIPGDILICNLETELSSKQDLKKKINNEYNDSEMDLTPGPSSPKAKLKRKDPKHFTRTVIINHSRKLREYEHKKRMEMAEEEHSLKMTIMREEHEIKMKIERERLRRLKIIVNRIRNRRSTLKVLK